MTLTRNFTNARSYLQHSLEFFRQVSPFDMENVRLTSGFGGRKAEFWQRETTPLRVGEAAGFQDYLWGFGIRYALHSGNLAAQAIAQGSDYHQAIRAQIRPQIYASLFNRAVYNRVGDRAYRFLVGWFSRSPQLFELLGGRYPASILAQQLLRLQTTQPDAAVQGGHE
jgi:flavin-dependent dehydrogenase